MGILVQESTSHGFLEIAVVAGHTLWYMVAHHHVFDLKIIGSVWVLESEILSISEWRSCLAWFLGIGTMRRIWLFFTFQLLDGRSFFGRWFTSWSWEVGGWLPDLLWMFVNIISHVDILLWGLVSKWFGGWNILVKFIWSLIWLKILLVYRCGWCWFGLGCGLGLELLLDLLELFEFEELLVLVKVNVKHFVSKIQNWRYKVQVFKKFVFN